MNILKNSKRILSAFDSYLVWTAGYYVTKADDPQSPPTFLIIIKSIYVRFTYNW